MQNKSEQAPSDPSLLPRKPLLGRSSPTFCGSLGGSRVAQCLPAWCAKARSSGARDKRKTYQDAKLKLKSPAAGRAGHGFVEGLLKAGRAECAGLIGAAGDDGAVRHRRLGLAAGEVCVQRRPVLLSKRFGSDGTHTKENRNFSPMCATKRDIMCLRSERGGESRRGFASAMVVSRFARCE